jgi:hypothetical protein
VSRQQRRVQVLLKLGVAVCVAVIDVNPSTVLVDGNEQ